MAEIKQAVVFDVDASQLDSANKKIKDTKEATEEAGKSAKGLGESVNSSLSSFDAMSSRLGQVANAVNLLSGMMIVDLARGIHDTVIGLYEITDAGKAAKRESEAMASAFSEVNSELGELVLSSRLAGDEIARLAVKTADVTIAEENYQEAMDKLVQAQRDRNKAEEEYNKILENNDGLFSTEDLNLRHKAYLRTSKALADQKVVVAGLTETLRSEREERKKLQEEVTAQAKSTNKLLGALTTEVKTRFALLTISAKSSYNEVEDALTKLLGDAQKKWDQYTKAQEDAAKKAAAARQKGISEVLKLEADAQALIDTGAEKNYQRDKARREKAAREKRDAIARERDEAMLRVELAERNAEARERRDEEEKAALDEKIAKYAQLNKVFSAGTSIAEAAFTVGNKSLVQAVDQAKVAKLNAKTKEQEAQAAKEVEKAEKKLAEEREKQQRILAGFKAAESFAFAAVEGAKAIAKFGDGEYINAAAHTLAAVQFVASGVKWSAMADGAGGAPSLSMPGGKDGPSEADKKGAQGDSGGEGGVTINLNFTGQPLATNTEIQDYLVEGINAAGTRRSARRINTRRVRQNRR